MREKVNTLCLIPQSESVLFLNFTVVLSLIQAKILAVGSHNPSHNKAELLSVDEDTWSTLPDYESVEE